MVEPEMGRHGRHRNVRICRNPLVWKIRAKRLTRTNRYPSSIGPVTSWCVAVGVPATAERPPEGAEERRVWRNGRRPQEVHDRKGQDCRPGDHEGESPEVDVPRVFIEDLR